MAFIGRGFLLECLSLSIYGYCNYDVCDPNVIVLKSVRVRKYLYKIYSSLLFKCCFCFLKYFKHTNRDSLQTYKKFTVIPPNIMSLICYVPSLTLCLLFFLVWFFTVCMCACFWVISHIPFFCANLFPFVILFNCKLCIHKNTYKFIFFYYYYIVIVLEVF